MKLSKILLILFLLCGAMGANAGVTFKFNAHSEAGRYKYTMECNLSALLTEINRAGQAGVPLNLSGLSSAQMEPGAKENLSNLWNNMAYFTCNKTTVISLCLNDVQGYQVRNIPVTLKFHEAAPGESNHKELVVSFNRRGTITGVRFAWDLQEDVSSMMGKSLVNGVADAAERRELLKWVEDFRSYYNEKNITALENIYSDDALIITGSVQKRVKKGPDGQNVVIKSTVVHRQQSKEEYIKKLRHQFRNRIDVKFDHISVRSHSSKPKIYGVLLHQAWTNGGYHDEGWLFLVWDFTNPDQPQIHVRTWQADEAVAEEGYFTLDDFFFP